VRLGRAQGTTPPYGGSSTAPTRAREGPVSLFTADRRQSVIQELLEVDQLTTAVAAHNLQWDGAKRHVTGRPEGLS
jgi:hypothetical protein